MVLGCSPGKLSVAKYLLSYAWLSLLVCGVATGQTLNFPTSNSRFGTMVSLDAIQTAQMDFDIFRINTQNPEAAKVESASASVSRLDLKAPSSARREYARGYQMLMRKDLHNAIEHLAKAIQIYPSFVAAHNALGSAFLQLDQNKEASDEFSKAVALDDHLPNSCLNLGIAQMALKDFADAEQSLRKAAALAPLDLQLSTALAYGEFANHNYAGVISTAQDVHKRKHRNAALIHFFAAGAWEALDNLPQAQREMETLLQEDPKSPSKAQFEQILAEIKNEQALRAEAKGHSPQSPTFSFSTPVTPTREQASAQAQQLLQTIREKSQIAEAEADTDPSCAECATGISAQPTPTLSTLKQQQPANFSGTVLRASVDEVAIFFSATDHGKSVGDLDQSDISVRDDHQAPRAIVSFRNESQLPLRLGLILDTSNSVTNRFSFEQSAANKFLHDVMTGENDLAFVIGVNNSVLLVQDFTSDLTATTRAVGQLAPGGGTALWDAVGFAADKLAQHGEPTQVARILVVISDGKDNTSALTLKEAITKAQHGEVAVYTVSTRENHGGADDPQEDEVGDHALRALSDLTGGTSLKPGSVRGLSGSLASLKEVIRGRYLISYRPATFERNGRYRTIDISAQKGGHRLKIFARKGYYASAAGASTENP